MRKSGLKQRSRRKGIIPPPPNVPNSEASSPGPVMESASYGSDSGERRKLTNEEAALSSRNNRLAKELNELRVRLRDETKTVTRLTMENMNLATRCREAISHVAILKKELDMIYRRESESLQQEKGSLPSSADNLLERDVRHMLPSNPLHALKHEQVPRNPKHEESPQDTYIDNSDELFAPFDGDEDDEDTDEDSQYDLADNVSTPTHSSVANQEVPADELMYDNEIGSMSRSEDSNFTTPVVNGVPISSDHFLQTSNNSTQDTENLFHPTPLHSNNQNKQTFDRNGFDSFGSPVNTKTSDFKSTADIIQSSSLSPSNKSAQIKSQQNSSLDAFEASFENTFPPMFSSSFEEASPLSISFDRPEFPDPFFLGSLDLGSNDSSGSVFSDLGRSSIEPVTSKRGNSNASDSKDISEKNAQGSLNAFSSGLQKKVPSSVPAPPGNLKYEEALQFESKTHDERNEQNFDEFHSTSLDFFQPTANIFEFTDETKTPKNNRSKLSPKNHSFQTPDTIQSSTEDFNSNREGVSPRVVKKSGTNSARSRYLAATGNYSENNNGSGAFEANGNTSNNGQLSGQKKDADQQNVNNGQTSRRLNLRKKKVSDPAGMSFGQDGNRSHLANKKTPLSNPSTKITEKRKEIGRLPPGQIASSNHTTTNKFSGPSNGEMSKSTGRRNVRHPVSYAEPSLNSKIRRGHEFFPKKELSSEATNKDKKDAEAYDDILKDLASSSVIHNVS